jgi:hypothetical protein
MNSKAMRNRFSVIFLMVFGSMLLSCEKVIDIPLNPAEQNIVIEAVLKDAPGANYVLISKTGSVYEGQEYDQIDDAEVIVAGSDGSSVVFDHITEGLYQNASFQTLPELTYSLTVNIGEATYTSSCVTRRKPEMDSLSYFMLTSPFADPADSLHLVSFHMLDPVDEDNYYLMKIFRNGIVNSGYYLGDDEFINGQNFDAPFFGSEAKPGDTVMVEMIMMDASNYRYFTGLSSTIDSGPFSAAPANPPTNIEGGALGFFGAYSTDSLTVMIP